MGLRVYFVRNAMASMTNRYTLTYSHKDERGERETETQRQKKTKKEEEEEKKKHNSQLR